MGIGADAISELIAPPTRPDQLTPREDRARDDAPSFQDHLASADAPSSRPAQRSETTQSRPEPRDAEGSQQASQTEQRGPAKEAQGAEPKDAHQAKTAPEATTTAASASSSAPASPTPQPHAQ